VKRRIRDTRNPIFDPNAPFILDGPPSPYMSLINRVMTARTPSELLALVPAVVAEAGDRLPEVSRTWHRRWETMTSEPVPAGVWPRPPTEWPGVPADQLPDED
jgi:hypothetical protein